MISIIPSSTFKTVPWKNGKGETTELAINSTGTLDNFQWRLSIASVTENGIFSDFSGYKRNLILIKGHSIQLTHDENIVDKLSNILDFATFDGGSETFGALSKGAIKDFNIITSKTSCETKVHTFVNQTNQSINFNGLVFAFSLSDIIELQDHQSVHHMISQGDLLQLTNPKHIELSGKDLILVYIKETNEHPTQN
ncbi:MAG: HutD family protein [Thalassotalea sp.]|nr:HutD family protein [Thalassotalea sp.]